MYRQRHLRLREFNFLHNTTARANNGEKIVCTKDSARGFALLLLLNTGANWSTSGGMMRE